MRPRDEDVFMGMAETAAGRSICSRAAVGAVITSVDGLVVATGRNGPPRGYGHGERMCAEWCARATPKYSYEMPSLPGVELVLENEKWWAQRIDQPGTRVELTDERIMMWGGKRIEVVAPGHSVYDDCPSLHAEANALLTSERSQRLGGRLYVTGDLCYGCAKLIANSGIGFVIVKHNEDDATRRESERGYRLLERCGVWTGFYDSRPEVPISWAYRQRWE